MYDLKLEMRLQHWATWAIMFLNKKKGALCGLGYPSESAISKFLREGYTENRAKGSSEPYNYPEAEQINTIYNRLKAVFPLKAQVLRKYYLSRESIKRYAIRKNVKPNTMYVRLRSAKKWVSDELERELKRERLRNLRSK